MSPSNASFATQGLLALVVEALEDVKGQDIKTLQLNGKSTMADALVICTGTSHTHLESLADRVISRLVRQGIEPAGVEGQSGSGWILVDVGDIVIHLFLEETRQHYNLEKMWSFSFEIDDGLEEAEIAS